MIYYSIGKHIKESGVSYRKLAEAIGLSYATVANLANAKNQEDYEVSSYVLNKICAYFKLQPADLLKYKST